MKDDTSTPTSEADPGNGGSAAAHSDEIDRRSRTDSPTTVRLDPSLASRDAFDLRESEARYRSLFDRMGQGYCELELIRDEDGRAVDQLYLAFNPAFERIFGIPRDKAEGRRAREVFPDLELWWIDSFDGIAKSGEPGRMEHEIESLNRWYEVLAYPQGGDRLTAFFEDITERKRAELALRDSEEKYRTLFERMGQGYSLNEVVRDPEGRAIDMRYLELNPAFERLTGAKVSEAVGRLASEVFPGLDRFWVEIVDRVLKSGAIERIEHELTPNRRWYQSSFYPAGNDRCLSLYDDITERKRAEIALKESEERQAFILKLADALRPLRDAGAVQEVAVRFLGEELKVDRCYYAEFDWPGDVLHIHHEYIRTDAVSAVGAHPISAFQDLLQFSHKGEPLVCDDVAAHPIYSSELAAYRERGTDGFILIPLVKQGTMVACICVTMEVPRSWKPSEVELVSEVAERTWAAVERARSETALATELRSAEALQSVSSQLIKEGDGEDLYDKILDEAMTIMDARFGSLQLRDDGELKLIAWRNFHPESAKYWERVSVSTGTSCGSALGHGERVIIPDVEQCEMLKDTKSLREYRRSGIKAVQSTPLTSREGRVIGMISTHWRDYHVPEDRQLRLFDVLARQAADFIERGRSEESLRRSERHAQTLLAELQHRVRNTLAVVRSIARRTADNSTTAQDMLAHFQGRLDAFSRVQAAVTRHPDGMVNLKSLIEDELVAHAARDGRQIRLDGPDMDLQPKVAERLSLAIHELTTNAVKHGALTNGHGHVDVRWESQAVDGEANGLFFRWSESGVPLDGRPARRRGFGMELLLHSLPYDLNAETSLEFRRDGLYFELALPLGHRASDG